MKFEIGDILLVDGQVWTVTKKSRNRPVTLESSFKTIDIYIYEIKDWMNLHKDSKYFPVVK
jgi:hypothetical protein